MGHPQHGGRYGAAQIGIGGSGGSGEEVGGEKGFGQSRASEIKVS
jgi:hypothetical protein